MATAEGEFKHATSTMLSVDVDACCVKSSSAASAVHDSAAIVPPDVSKVEKTWPRIMASSTAMDFEAAPDAYRTAVSPAE
jgi:hypothetical protein